MSDLMLIDLNPLYLLKHVTQIVIAVIYIYYYWLPILHVCEYNRP